MLLLYGALAGKAALLLTWMVATVLEILTAVASTVACGFLAADDAEDARLSVAEAVMYMVALTVFSGEC